MPELLKRCPRCYLAGSQIGNCGDHTIGCPPPVDTNPKTDVVIQCIPCNRLVSIPIERIMQGKIKAITGRCNSDRCAAQIISGEASPVAPPLSAETLPFRPAAPHTGGKANGRKKD